MVLLKGSPGETGHGHCQLPLLGSRTWGTEGAQEASLRLEEGEAGEFSSFVLLWMCMPLILNF